MTSRFYTTLQGDLLAITCQAYQTATQCCQFRLKQSPSVETFHESVLVYHAVLSHTRCSMDVLILTYLLHIDMPNRCLTKWFVRAASDLNTAGQSAARSVSRRDPVCSCRTHSIAPTMNRPIRSTASTPSRFWSRRVVYDCQTILYVYTSNKNGALQVLPEASSADISCHCRLRSRYLAG